MRSRRWRHCAASADIQRTALGAHTSAIGVNVAAIVFDARHARMSDSILFREPYGAHREKEIPCVNLCHRENCEEEREERERGEK